MIKTASEVQLFFTNTFHSSAERQSHQLSKQRYKLSGIIELAKIYENEFPKGVLCNGLLKIQCITQWESAVPHT